MTRTDYSRECWVGAVGRAPQHLTADERFDETLNDAGVISFFDPDSLVIEMGEGVDIGEGDLYRVEVDDLTVTNLTGTSGITEPPHDYGTIVLADGVHELPEGSGWLIRDSRRNKDSEESVTGRVLRVDREGRVSTLLEDVEVLERVERTGGFVVAVVERSPGPVPGQVVRDILQLELLGDRVESLRVPPGTVPTRLSGSASRDQLAVVVSNGAGEWLGQVRVPSASGLVLSSLFLQYGPTIAQNLAGDVYASLHSMMGNTFFVWTGDVAIPLLTTPGFVLPGE
jgi:hypothetical protein